MTAPGPGAAGVAAADHRHPARPPAGERCDMCAEPITDAHQHVVDLESRALMCTCRACYLLFTADRATLRYRAVPDRYLSFPDVTLGPARLGRPADPGRAGLPVPQLGAGPGGRVLPGTRGRHRVRAAARRLAADPGRPPAAGLLRPDVEALLVRGAGPDRAGLDCHLVPIDACYELVGRLRSLWRGFDGGQQADAAIDAFFDDVGRRSRPAPGRHRPTGPGAHRDRLRVLGRRRLRRALRGHAAADRAAADHGVHRPDRARDRAALPGPHRAAAPAATSRPTRAGLRALFGDRDRWADTLRPFLWMQCSTMVQGFTGVTEVDLALPCTYDFEVTGVPLPARRSATASVPLTLLFSGTVFTKGGRGSPSSRCRGTARPRTGCRSRCGRT